MPVHETRKLRNFAATLSLISGGAHVGQLWYTELDALAMATALLGIFYFLLGLGLAGQSRFSLWMAIVIPVLSVFALGEYLLLGPQIMVAVLLITLDTLIIAIAAYILFKTRHAEMD